jgi:hypothetical protein
MGTEEGDGQLPWQPGHTQHLGAWLGAPCHSTQSTEDTTLHALSYVALCSFLFC